MRRLLSWIAGIVVTGLLAAALAGCGRGAAVEAVRVRRGVLREEFAEPAKTRLPQTYRISMPVDGRIGRIDVAPGDQVRAGQRLASFDLVPFEQEVAEARAAVAELEAQIEVKDNDRIEQTAIIETEATVEAAEEALKAAEAQVEAERARADRAAKELARMQALATSEVATQSALEDAQLAAETAAIELKRQEFYRAALGALLVAVRLGPKYVDAYLGRKRLERQVLVHPRGNVCLHIAGRNGTLPSRTHGFLSEMTGVP